MSFVSVARVILLLVLMLESDFLFLGSDESLPSCIAFLGSARQEAKRHIPFDDLFVVDESLPIAVFVFCTYFVGTRCVVDGWM